jgi:hypothetical protein
LLPGRVTLKLPARHEDVQSAWVNVDFARKSRRQRKLQKVERTLDEEPGVAQHDGARDGLTGEKARM